MESKLIFLVGTSPIQTLERLLEEGEHYFSQDYSIALMDTQPLSSSSSLSRDFVQLSAKEGMQTFFNSQNKDIDFIKGQILPDDIHKIEKYSPTAGGAGGKWEGGFCAFFSQINFIKNRIVTFTSQAREPFDIIITGGSMGGTKSGVLIPLLFLLEYLFTESESDLKGKNYRLNLIITIPDGELETRPDAIKRAWKENAEVILRYLKRFMENMDRKGQINRILVYFLRPGKGVDEDNRILLKLISLLTNDEIPSRLIDVPMQQGKNLFVIHFKDNFIHFKKLEEFLVNDLMRHLCEEEMKKLQEPKIDRPEEVLNIIVQTLKDKIQRIPTLTPQEWVSQAINIIETENFSNILKQRFFNALTDCERIKNILEDRNKCIQEILNKAISIPFGVKSPAEELTQEDIRQLEKKINEKLNKILEHLDGLIKDYEGKIASIDEALAFSLEQIQNNILAQDLTDMKISDQFKNFFNRVFSDAKGEILSSIYNQSYDKAIGEIKSIFRRFIESNKRNIEVKLHNILNLNKKFEDFLNDLNSYLFQNGNIKPIHNLTQFARSDALPYLTIWINYTRLNSHSIYSSIRNFDNLGALQPSLIEIERNIGGQMDSDTIFKQAFVCFIPFKELGDIACIDNGFYKIQ